MRHWVSRLRLCTAPCFRGWRQLTVIHEQARAMTLDTHFNLKLPSTPQALNTPAQTKGPIKQQLHLRQCIHSKARNLSVLRSISALALHAHQVHQHSRDHQDGSPVAATLPNSHFKQSVPTECKNDLRRHTAAVKSNLKLYYLVARVDQGVLGVNLPRAFHNYPRL